MFDKLIFLTIILSVETYLRIYLEDIEMKNIALASTLCAAVILSGCGGGSDGGGDTPTVVAEEFISISGKITNIDDTGEPGVAIEGVYSSPGDLLNPRTTTDTNGDFALSGVVKGEAVFLRATKDNFATINSAKTPFNVNITGLYIGMPTGEQAQSVIDDAFTAMPVLQNHAWLVVDVEDDNGDSVGGETVASTITPADQVYTDCDGADNAASVTTGPFSGDRPGPMYIAYFDAAGEAAITVGSEMQTAPIRKGEITYLEFETVASTAGSIEAGRLKYDNDCAYCHAAGTYDDVSESASDLIGDSDDLIVNINSYAPNKKIGVAKLTAQEILDLTAFLDSL